MINRIINGLSRKKPNCDHSCQECIKMKLVSGSSSTHSWKLGVHRQWRSYYGFSIFPINYYVTMISVTKNRWCTLWKKNSTISISDISPAKTSENVTTRISARRYDHSWRECIKIKLAGGTSSAHSLNLGVLRHSWSYNVF